MNNLLAEIAFPDSGTDRVAIYQQTYGGNEYAAKIKKGTEIVETMGLDGTYEVPMKTLILDDSDRYYRQKLITTSKEHITNASVILRDGNGTIQSTNKIESWAFPPNEFLLRISDKIDLLKDFTSKISTAIWANAPTESIGQVIPKVYNSYARIKAWLIKDVVNQYDWLLGTKQISSVTRVEVNGDVVDPLYVTYSLSNDGTYWWLNLAHGVIVGAPAGYPKFIWVDVTTPAYTPLQIITDLVSSVVTVGTNASFAARLAAQGYTSSNVHFYLDRAMSAEEALKIFCDSFSCFWRKDSAGEIVFEWVSRSSITIDKLFRGWPYGGDILTAPEQTQDYQPIEIKNEITYSYDRNSQAGKYNSTATYSGSEQSDGIYREEVEFEYLTESVQAAVTVAERYHLNKEPSNTISFGTQYEIGSAITPGDKIQVEHRNNITVQPMFGIVTKKRIDPVSQTIQFDFVEKNYLYPWFCLLTADGRPILTAAGYPIILG